MYSHVESVVLQSPHAGRTPSHLTFLNRQVWHAVLRRVAALPLFSTKLEVVELVLRRLCVRGDSSSV